MLQENSKTVRSLSISGLWESIIIITIIIIINLLLWVFLHWR